MKNNLISILCPSFNHEKYINVFINSLLKQTNPNWELIIVDDCSTDNNVAEIEKFRDNRIKLFKNPFNMGINCSINHAFEHANGDFMVFSASDDILTNDFVETILNNFNAHPDIDVIYSNLQPMNYDGTIKNNDIWKQPKDDKNTLLRYMFFNGNKMLSPGMAFRKQAFAKICPLPIALSQYQDYKIHIDVALNLNSMTIDNALVFYRKPSKKSGISVENTKTLRTRQLEENILMDSFLQIKDVSRLQEIFGNELLKQFGTLHNKFLPYYLGILALNATTEYKKVWGYNQIIRFITIPENYILLHKQHGFCYKDFLNLADKFGQSNIERKYIKYKKLFNKFIIYVVLLLIVISFICF